MRSKILWVGLGVFVFVAVAGSRAWQGDPEAAKLKNPVASTPESIGAGETIFKRRCSACHGLDAKGGPAKEEFLKPGSNLVDDTTDHGGTEGEIFTVIKNGVPPEFVMYGWGERLSDTEIWSLVNYLQDLKKKQK